MMCLMVAKYKMGNLMGTVVITQLLSLLVKGQENDRLFMLIDIIPSLFLSHFSYKYGSVILNQSRQLERTKAILLFALSLTL